MGDSVSRSSAERRRRHLVLTARTLSTVLAILVAGCTEAGYDAVQFRNDTTQTISVVHEAPTGQEAIIVHAIRPGQVGSDDAVAGGHCTIGVLIARDESGNEVARRTEPLCLGDTWSIVPSR
jgi:hypothetical protein